MLALGVVPPVALAHPKSLIFIHLGFRLITSPRTPNSFPTDYRRSFLEYCHTVCPMGARVFAYMVSLPVETV